MNFELNEHIINTLYGRGFMVFGNVKFLVHLLDYIQNNDIKVGQKFLDRIQFNLEGQKMRIIEMVSSFTNEIKSKYTY